MANGPNIFQMLLVKIFINSASENLLTKTRTARELGVCSSYCG